MQKNSGILSKKNMGTSHLMEEKKILLNVKDASFHAVL